MSGCNCSGSCGSCGGCARALELTQGELDLLYKLAQTPFLPVARKAEDMTAVYLEDDDYSREQYSLILACMEKKGLIDLDYRQALIGFDYSGYSSYGVHGSMALTARGQDVLTALELQGIEKV